MQINLGLFSMTFLTQANMTEVFPRAEYSIPLVIVSYLFAFAGSYVGLLTSQQITMVGTRFEKIFWLGAGATAMGAGIWSMHFIGMLASQHHFEVHYSVALTIFSIFPAIGASFLALHLLSRMRVRMIELALGSVLMGAGIGAMHYIGMAAMHLEATLAYDPYLFALSIVVAVLFAYVALTAKVRLKRWRRYFHPNLVNPSSAAIMGVAIAGMHYTAMSATRFLPGDSHGNHYDGVDIGFMLILINVLVFLLIFLIFSAILARKAYTNTALVKIIEQMRALENRLEKNLENFQTTVESFPGGICLFDDHQVMTLANQGYYDVLQLPSEDFPIGTRLEDILWFHAVRGEYGSGDPEEMVRTRMADVQLLETLKFERTRATDGKILQFTRVPLSTGGFLQIVTDVTETRKAEEARASMERDMSQTQKMEALGTLASGVAHEINTPIQYIGDNIRFLQESFTDLVGLLEGYRSTQKEKGASADSAALAAKEEEIDLDFLLEELPQSMTQSLEGIGQVAGIVNAIKEFSHPGQEEMAAVDLNSSIRTTLTVSRNQWKYVANVETDLAPDLPPVNCYHGDINQVILNMVVNAAHAIEDSERAVDGQIRITTTHDDTFVEIVIADNGGGMPEDVRKRIYDPFFTTKDIGKGTGQGLAISYAIVHQKHGGSIECASEVGVGTSFTIRLPIDGTLLEGEQAA